MGLFYSPRNNKSAPSYILLLSFVIQSSHSDSNCQTYSLEHTGCSPTNYCGSVQLLYNSTNATQKNIGKRFAYDSGGRLITSTLVPPGLNQSIVHCALQCQAYKTCKGFALVYRNVETVTCNTVNDSTATVGTVLHTLSYSFNRRERYSASNPLQQHQQQHCHVNCGSGRDGLAYQDIGNVYPVVGNGTRSELEAQCAQICNRVMGCRGFLLNIDGGLCTAVTNTSDVAKTLDSVSSYKMIPATGSPNNRQSIDKSPTRIHPTTEDEVVDSWVVHSTERIFPQDTRASTVPCPQQAAKIMWNGYPGMVVAAQIALRLTTHASVGPLEVEFSPLKSASHTMNSSSLQGRLVGFVQAERGDRYLNEIGNGSYPDILADIHTLAAKCDNKTNSCDTFSLACVGTSTGGCRFSYDKGGRQRNMYSNVSQAECEKFCASDPECRGYVLAKNNSLCRTVNDSSVLVGNEGVSQASYRRKYGGFMLYRNVTRSLWIDLTILEDITPDQYDGMITIKSATSTQGGLPAPINIPISLQVHNVSLPNSRGDKSKNPSSKRHKLFGKAWGFDHNIVHSLYSLPGSVWPTQDIVDDYEILMCKHHAPAETLASSLALTRNISDIRKLLARPCNQKYFNLAFIGISNHLHPENITEAYINDTLDRIAPRVAEIEAAGLIDKGYIYGFDEAGQQFEQVVYELFGAIKRRWPRVKTLGVLNWPLPKDIPVDIWVAQYQFFDSPDFAASQAQLQANGKEVWGYHCISPDEPQYLNSFLDVPTFKSRLIPWFAALKDFDGWLYWYTNWGAAHAPSARDNATGVLHPVEDIARNGMSPYNPRVVNPPIDKTSFSNEDGNLVYTTVEGPQSSIRLENLLHGWQDMILLHSVTDDQQRKTLINMMITSATSYNLNSTKLEEVRLLVLKTITTQQARNE